MYHLQKLKKEGGDVPGNSFGIPPVLPFMIPDVPSLHVSCHSGNIEEFCPEPQSTSYLQFAWNDGALPLSYVAAPFIV